MLNATPESALKQLWTTAPGMKRVAGVIPVATTVCAPPHDAWATDKSESRPQIKGTVSPKHPTPWPKRPKSPLPQHASSREQEASEDLTMRHLEASHFVTRCLHITADPFAARTSPKICVKTGTACKAYGTCRLGRKKLGQTSQDPAYAAQHSIQETLSVLADS